MQRSFTSSAFLFPSPNVWNSSQVLVATADRNYTTKDIPDFFNDINYQLGHEQYKMASPALITEPPGVPLHCIYGLGVNTPELFTWARGYFPDYQPVISYGDGDGTVNRQSLEVCRKWANDTKGKVVSYNSYTYYSNLSSR
jgi:lysophospholipase-3